MRGAVTVGHVSGIPIDLQFSLPPVFLFISWTLAARFFPALYPAWPVIHDWMIAMLGSTLLFVSLLAHELGHALVAQRRGRQVFRISLFCLGGLAEIDVDSGTASDELWMALAGPAVSALLAVGWSSAGMALNAHSPWLGAAMLYLGISNLLLVVFNLLPGYPLDGGRVLRAVLWHRWGDQARATRWASWIGQGVGGLGIAIGVVALILGDPIVGLWLVAMGTFLALAARGTISSIFLPSS